MRTWLLLPALLAFGCAGSDRPGSADDAVRAAETFDYANKPRLPGVAIEDRWALLPLAGTPAHEPWTGWWWPFEHQRDNERNGIAYEWNGRDPSPAAKFDRAYGLRGSNSVAQWELENHAGGTLSWAGHCDGWSLASSVMPEPLVPVSDHGVCFYPADVKALLTEAFECDMTGQQVTLLGRECMDASPDKDANGRMQSAACRDVNPGLFHLTLANVIGMQRRAFFMDHYTAEEIWNYPIRWYESTADEPRAPSADEQVHAPSAAQVVHVTTTIEYLLEDQPKLERTYLKVATRYEYLLELDGAGRVVGGEWLGSSIADHPDALKVPFVDAKPQHTRGECNNPNLDFDRVLELARRSATGTTAECGATP